MTETKLHRKIINRALLYEEISTLRAAAGNESERRKTVLNKLRDALNCGRKEIRTQFDSSRSNGIKTGLGILLKNFWNTELEYFSQTIGFQSEKYISNSSIIDDNNDIYSIDNRNISGFRIKANFDILDDVLLPNDGIIFNGELEESNNKLGSDWYYKFYKIEGTAYRTFHLNTYGITVYYHNLYKQYLGFLLDNFHLDILLLKPLVM